MSIDVESDREYRDLLLRFARDELEPDAAGRNARGEFDRSLWKRCAALGLQGLPVPPGYGGAGASMRTIAVAMEALGEGTTDNGLLFSLNAHLWAVTHPLVRFGSEEQKQHYLPGMCDGSIVAAHAASEPEAGSDTFSMTTTATRDDDGYVLRGSKTFVTNGPVADVFLVFATTDRASRFAGLCAFLVDRDTPGLTVGAPIQKMGLTTSPMSEVFLDDCRVPTSARLGREGAGMAIFTSSMEQERTLILASTVGSMQRQLDRVVAYARGRRQFGTPIGEFQAVSHRIVEMYRRLETSRLLLTHCAEQADAGGSIGTTSALVKLHLAESFIASSQDALQLHGGYGYMVEYDLERDVRDSLAARIYSGTSDIQRNIVAAGLGL